MTAPTITIVNLTATKALTRAVLGELLAGHRTIGWFAPSWPDATAAHKAAEQTIPTKLIAKIAHSHGRTYIELTNNSRIEFHAATIHAARGCTYDVIALDRLGSKPPAVIESIAMTTYGATDPVILSNDPQTPHLP